MKKSIIIILLFLGYSSMQAQVNLTNARRPFYEVFPIVEEKMNYTGVVEVPGASSAELYKNAKIWLVDAFKSAKDVIQNDDKDNHIIKDIRRQ